MPVEHRNSLRLFLSHTVNLLCCYFSEPLYVCSLLMHCWLAHSHREPVGHSFRFQWEWRKSLTCLVSLGLDVFAWTESLASTRPSWHSHSLEQLRHSQNVQINYRRSYKPAATRCMWVFEYITEATVFCIIFYLASFSYIYRNLLNQIMPICTCICFLLSHVLFVPLLWPI